MYLQLSLEKNLSVRTVGLQSDLDFCWSLHCILLFRVYESMIDLLGYSVAFSYDNSNATTPLYPVRVTVKKDVEQIAALQKVWFRFFLMVFAIILKLFVNSARNRVLADICFISGAQSYGQICPRSSTLAKEPDLFIATRGIFTCLAKTLDIQANKSSDFFTSPIFPIWQNQK